MNLKKTVLSLFAAGAILAGGFGGATAQTVSSSQTGATVTVVPGGAFNAQFCGAISFGNATVTSSAGATVNGALQICYTDTLPYRNVFRTYLTAGPFVDASINKSIPATAAKPTTIYNVAQGQWTTNHPDGLVIGDIGAMKGNATYSGGTGGYVNNAGTVGPWVGGTLDGNLYVGYGNAGVGTGGTRYLTVNGGNVIPELTNGSVATIGLKLDVPVAQQPGTYVSEFVLSIDPVAP